MEKNYVKGEQDSNPETFECQPSTGAIQLLRNAVGVCGCQLSRKKRYEGVRFNVISVTRGWVGDGGQIP